MEGKYLKRLKSLQKWIKSLPPLKQQLAEYRIEDYHPLKQTKYKQRRNKL